MRHKSTWSCLLLLPILLLSAPIAAQQTPQRDPQALTVLTQMTAATGWNPYALPTDALASGTVIVEKPTGPQTKNIVIKARPGQQLRTEFPSDGSVFVVNGAQGKHITSAGSEDWPSQTTYSMAPFMLPFFTILGEYGASNVSVAYLGTEVIQGNTAYRIELKRFSSTGPTADPNPERASRIVVAISATTYLPLKIEFEKLSAQNPHSGLVVACYLSDYRRVGSVLVPFHVEQIGGGIRSYTLQLETVQLNVGLSDSEFTLP